VNENIHLPVSNNSNVSRKSSELKKFIELPTEHKCEDSAKLITRVLDGVPNPSVIQSLRNHFGLCSHCTNAFEIEIRFKLAMAQKDTVKAPPSLQLKISETLQRVDLGDITISDL
tara:strand:- start:57454 stop:57798 length:345 start_codon:yes stop_codon:yes gene_type:complete